MRYFVNDKNKSTPDNKDKIKKSDIDLLGIELGTLAGKTNALLTELTGQPKANKLY
jgi:hypothetical protein